MDVLDELIARHLRFRRRHAQDIGGILAAPGRVVDNVMLEHKDTSGFQSTAQLRLPLLECLTSHSPLGHVAGEAAEAHEAPIVVEVGCRGPLEPDDAASRGYKPEAVVAEP